MVCPPVEQQVCVWPSSETRKGRFHPANGSFIGSRTKNLVVSAH